MISSPQVILVQLDAIVDTIPRMVVVLPPFSEIPVGQLKSRDWKRVPSFLNFDTQVDDPFVNRDGPDRCSIKQMEVEQFLLILFQNIGKIALADDVTLPEFKLTVDYITSRVLISRYGDMVY